MTGAGAGSLEQADKARAERSPAAPSDQRVETERIVSPPRVGVRTLRKRDTQSRVAQDGGIIASSRLFSMVNLRSISKMVTILIFGAAVRPDGTPSGALRRRVEAALAYADGDPEALFVPTGGIGRHGPSEASVMAALLRESGVPDSRILPEDTARNTVSSVRAIRRLLRREGVSGPLRVATSAYHLPRCLTLLCLAGMAARPCPPPPQSAAASAWKRWYWRLREVPALPCDSLMVLGLRLTGRL